MIVSNMSGIRLLSLYKADLAYIKTMYADSDAWNFEKAPAFEIVTTSVTVPVVTLVNFDTEAETTPTVTPSDLDHRGTAYKINAVAETTPPTGGAYYYKVVLDSVTYYSAVFLVTCTADFEIQYLHSCANPLTGSDTLTNKVQIPGARIVPAGTEGEQRSIELADGSIRVTSSHARTVWRLELKGSRDLYERLQHVRHFDTVSVKAFGIVYPVKPYTFRVEGNRPTERTSVIVASFQIDAEDEITSCLCPEFVSEGTQGNGNGGSDDEAHPNMVVSIDAGSLPQLSASITGTPITPRTVRWYKDGVFFSTAETISIPNETAVWTLRVKVDGYYEQSATYTYVNECNLFSVEAVVTGSTLTANYNNIPQGESVTVSIKDSGDVEVATSLPFTPVATDTYTIEATAGQCVKTKAVYIDINAIGCGHTASIQQVGLEFQGVVGNPGAGTVTYLWEMIDENDQLFIVANTQNITPTRTGMYTFKVDIDGCTVASLPRLYLNSERVEIVNAVSVVLDDRYRFEKFNKP